MKGRRLRDGDSSRVSLADCLTGVVDLKRSILPVGEVLFLFIHNSEAKMDIDRSIRSPNYGPRDGRPISIVVVHATAGGLRSSLAWLTNAVARVSTHYVIAKDGYTFGLVDDKFAAWHAGISAWQGHIDVNERSLGLELVNDNDGKDPYPHAQLHAAVLLTRDLVKRYGILRSNLVRHLDVALPAGRKKDPAGFPWAWFVAEVYAAQPSPRLSTYQVTTLLPLRIRAQATTRSTQVGRRWWGQRIDGHEVAGEKVSNDARWVKVREGGYLWRGGLEVVDVK